MALLMILSLAAAVLVFRQLHIASAAETVSSEAGLYPTLQQREIPLFHQAQSHQGQRISFAPYKSASGAPVAFVYHQDNPSQPTQTYPTVNQQFQTFPQLTQPNFNPQLLLPAVSGSNQIPFATQHGYMILSPINPVTNGGLYLPNINNNYPQQTQKQNQIAHANVYIPVRHPQAKSSPNNQQTLKPPQPALQINSPLFHHQVYHPLHTSVRHNNNSNILLRPRLPPPKIYRNFHAMTPNSHAPPPRQDLRKPAAVEEEDEEEEDERAQVNESDDEEENENIEEEDEDDDDNSNLKEEESDEDDYRPFNYHPRYRNDDDDDHEPHHRSETRPKESKLSSGKHIYPKDREIGKSISAPFANPFDASHFISSFQGDSVFPGPAFEHPKPKVEVKMYKYVKSSANPPSEKEFIEGKGSEIKPVIQQNKKMYQEKWIISSKSSSSSF